MPPKGGGLRPPSLPHAATQYTLFTADAADDDDDNTSGKGTGGSGAGRPGSSRDQPPTLHTQTSTTSTGPTITVTLASSNDSPADTASATATPVADTTSAKAGGAGAAAGNAAAAAGGDATAAFVATRVVPPFIRPPSMGATLQHSASAGSSAAMGLGGVSAVTGAPRPLPIPTGVTDRTALLAPEAKSGSAGGGVASYGTTTAATAASSPAAPTVDTSSPADTPLSDSKDMKSSSASAADFMASAAAGLGLGGVAAVAAGFTLVDSASNISGGVPSAVEDSKLRQNRRNLLSAPDYWPGVKRLHWLFRIFDVNHNGKLNYTEFKQGLRDLGFDTSNDNAIKQMLIESVPEFSGHITEPDFIKLFRRLNRQSLQNRLQQESDYGGDATNTFVTIIDCGRYKNRLCFSQSELKPAQLAAKLDETRRTHGAWSDPFRWIDFCGHSPSALNVLANDLNLPAKLLHGIEFTSKPKCVVASESASSHSQKVPQSFLHICLPLLIPDRFPTRVTKTGVALGSEKEYLRSRPRLTRHEIHLVLIDKHTIVTVRKPENVNEEPPRELKEMWNEVITDLRTKFTSTGGGGGLLSLTTASSFLLELLDDIGDDNWLIADAIRDWEEAVAKGVEVTGDPDEKYELHLMDLTRICASAKTDLKTAADVMAALLLSDAGTAASPSAQAAAATAAAGGAAVAAGAAGAAGAGHGPLPPFLTVPSFGSADRPPPLNTAASGAAAAGGGGGLGLHFHEPSSRGGGGGGSIPEQQREPSTPPIRASTSFGLSDLSSPPYDSGAPRASGVSGGSYGGGFMPPTPMHHRAPSSSNLLDPAATGAGAGAGAGGSAGRASFGFGHAVMPPLQGHGPASAAAAAAAHPPVPHKLPPRAFILDHLDEYSEVSDSYGRLVADLQPLEDRAAALTKFYNSKHNNATKETLYLLTILTAFIAPVQIGTGIYGMNFKNMPELNTENGYFVFLLLVTGWLLVCVLWFLRKKKIL